MLRVDAIDQRIVSRLVTDARSSYAEIGKVVGLSAPAVKRRVDRLLDTGVLRGFTAVVDPEALGWGTEAFVEVHCRGNVSPDRIRRRLEPLSEVVAAYTVSGAADAIVHLRAGSIHHLEDAAGAAARPGHDRPDGVHGGACPPCWSGRRHPSPGTDGSRVGP